MDIGKLTKQEKSVLLAKARGWNPVPYTDPNASWWKSDGESFAYYPDRMSMFVGIEDESGERVSKGDQPFDDDDLEKHWKQCPNFYRREHMRLAWETLNWMIEYLADQANVFNVWDAYSELMRFLNTPSKWGKPNAQAAWLDKILSLAIEFGFVESEDV